MHARNAVEGANAAGVQSRHSAGLLQSYSTAIRRFDLLERGRSSSLLVAGRSGMTEVPRMSWSRAICAWLQRWREATKDTIFRWLI